MARRGCSFNRVGKGHLLADSTLHLLAPENVHIAEYTQAHQRVAHGNVNTSVSRRETFSGERVDIIIILGFVLRSMYKTSHAPPRAAAAVKI